MSRADYSTFFWGGETFAPELKVGSKNIQAFLQDAFFAAFGKLIDTVGNLDAVMGFEVGLRLPI